LSGGGGWGGSGVALHHILVVHDSPAVRETVGILLAGLRCETMGA